MAVGQHNRPQMSKAYCHDPLRAKAAKGLRPFAATDIYIRGCAFLRSGGRRSRPTIPGKAGGSITITNIIILRPADNSILLRNILIIYTDNLYFTLSWGRIELPHYDFQSYALPFKLPGLYFLSHIARVFTPPADWVHHAPKDFGNLPCSPRGRPPKNGGSHRGEGFIRYSRNRTHICFISSKMLYQSAIYLKISS